MKASFPADVTQPVQYGARVKALVGYFSQYQLLPYQRIQEIFQDVPNISISQGSINNILTQGYEMLGGFEVQVKAHLVSSDVVHFDETGIKVNKKKHWLHAASTAKLTYYLIHPRRGLEAMDAADILPNFTDRAVNNRITVAPT